MAFDDTEIEIKLAASEVDFERVQSALAATASLKSETDQSDHYFVPKNSSYLTERYPYEWLSVRDRGAKATVNYKHFYPEGAEHHSHCDELDVPIGDVGRMIQLLERAGFELVVTVRKRRQMYAVADDFEVSLDVVDDLGHFIEIEAIRDQGGVEKTREAVITYATSLGLSIQAVDPRGYPYQMLRQKGLVG